MALTIHTDRTSMVAYRNCPRLRLLSRHFGGKGIEPIRPSLALIQGIAVHGVLADIWEGKDPQAAILSHMPDLDIEQRTLFEGLIWAWIRTRYPLLSCDFEPMAIEKELVWKMGECQEVTVFDHIRCDGVLRRRSDGGLFYWEIKTSADPGDEWIKSWEHNSQLLINVMALEELLGERIQGVLIEGIAKGRFAIDKMRTSPWFGRKIQQSPLCYTFVDPLSGQFSTTWQKGWKKAQTRTVMKIKDYVQKVMTVEECAALFVPVPPIRPDPLALHRHYRQALWQESSIALALEECKSDPTALDRYFPLNDDHCYRYWGHPCEMESVCFVGSVMEAPLDSGLYRPRTPHHSLQAHESGAGGNVANPSHSVESQATNVGSEV